MPDPMNNAHPSNIDIKAIKKSLGIEDKPFEIKNFARTIGQGIQAEFKQMQTTMHKDWDAFERDARDLKLPKSRPYVGCANHSVSITSSNIDGIVPRQIDDIFGYDEPIQFQILDDSDEDKNLEMAGNSLMRWDIESHDDLKEEIWYFTENANKFGISFAYTYWEEEKDWDIIEEQVIVLPNGQTIPYSQAAIDQHQQMQQMAKAYAAQGHQVPQLPDLQTTVNSQKVYHWIKYNPKTICLDNKKVVWNSDATSLEDAFKNGFVAIQVEHTMDEIFKIMVDNPDQAMFQNLIELKNALNEFKSVNNVDQQYNNWKSKKLPFWLFWTRVDANDDGFEEQICGLLYAGKDAKNNSEIHILGIEAYAFDHKQCPIVSGRIKPIHKKINGIGIPEMLYADKQYLDTLRNQMDDFRRLYAAPRRLYDEDSGFNPAIHKYELGANWPLNRGFQNHMEIEEITPYTQDHWTEFKEVYQECNARLGSSQIEKGQMPDHTMTFHGMMQLLEESSKTRSMFKNWLGQSLQKIFYQRFRLYQQYWGREAMQDQQVQNWISQILKGSVKTKLPIDESILTVLDHNCNLVLKATQEDKKIESLKARDLFEFLTPYIVNPITNPYQRKLILDTAIAMGHPEAEEYLPTVEEIQAQQVAIQKQAMEQMQAEQEQQRQESIKQEEMIRHNERLRMQSGMEELAGVNSKAAESAESEN